MQVYACAAADHETFLRLKETEYANGVDVLWAICCLYLFSSFHRRAVLFRPILQIIKGLLIIAVAFGHNNMFNQAVFCSLVLFGCGVMIIIMRPHRVPILNALLVINFLCLGIDALIGAFLARFGVWNNPSPFFTIPYAYYELLLFNICWFLMTLVIIVIIFRRKFGLCGAKQNPLWPTLRQPLTSESSNDEMDKQSQQFTSEVVKSRLVLDRSMAMPAAFVPIHDLANQIQIINAFCREAEGSFSFRVKYQTINPKDSSSISQLHASFGSSLDSKRL